MSIPTKTGLDGPGSTAFLAAESGQSQDEAPPAVEDLRVLAAQAAALRQQGREAAADQLLAWRDLHAMRHVGTTRRRSAE